MVLHQVWLLRLWDALVLLRMYSKLFTHLLHSTSTSMSMIGKLMRARIRKVDKRTQLTDDKLLSSMKKGNG